METIRRRRDASRIRLVTGEFWINPKYDSGAALASSNPNPFGFITPIMVAHWTDATNWWLVADPAKQPTIVLGFLGGKQEPELFVQDMPNVGSMWNTDSLMYKIRHIYGRNILDVRSFYAGIVAG